MLNLVYNFFFKYKNVFLLLNVCLSSYYSLITMLHVSALEQQVESLKARLVTLQIKLATSVPTVIIKPVVPVVEPYSHGQWFLGILVVVFAIAFVCYFKGSPPDDFSPDLALNVEKPIAIVEPFPLTELLGKDTSTLVAKGSGLLVPLGFRLTHNTKKNLDIFDISDSALDWDWD